MILQQLFTNTNIYLRIEVNKCENKFDMKIITSHEYNINNNKEV